MKSNEQGAVPSPAMAGQAANSRQDRWIAGLLLTCVILAVFWELMANRSLRPQDPFAVTAQAFAGFSPHLPGWSSRRLDITPDPLEPNILAFRCTRVPTGLMPDDARATEVRSVLLRLVHGYNMVDCLRIKGESIELLADTRDTNKSEGGGAVAASANPHSAPDMPHWSLPPNTQLWRVTSATGGRGIWASAMLRAADLSYTDMDTRSMPFPHIGTPDNPGWFPRGLTWRSLRHPITNGALFLRAKWNSSRADPLTFLGLRQPAWASDDVLTLVALSLDAAVPPHQEAEVTRDVVDAHRLFGEALRRWHTERAAERLMGTTPPSAGPDSRTAP